MEWLKRNSLIVATGFISILMLGLLTIGFYQLAFFTVPNKLKQESSLTCQQQLETKSYQLKQFILENLNNSKIWLSNRRNTFFDTRWFAISFYEHDGREWILKDFKMNSVVLDVYKVVPSEYIKLEQTFVSPHPRSEQINIQQGQIQNLPLVVIDATNILHGNSSNHMVRISMFTDLVTSVLSSDSSCTMNLLTTRGNFIFNEDQIDKTKFLSKIQESMPTALNSTETQFFDYNGSQVISKKLLKNLYALSLANPKENAFNKAFLQFLCINGLCALVIFFLLLKIIRRKLKERVQSIQKNVRLLAEKNYALQFDLSKKDELTAIDEDLSATCEELKKTSSF